MLHKLFVNICDKTHHTNAHGNLFFALLEMKMGNREEANKRLGLARRFSVRHDYWRVRFSTLDLYKLLIVLEHDLENTDLSLGVNYTPQWP